MTCSNASYASRRTENVPWENFAAKVHYNVPSYFDVQPDAFEAPAGLKDLVWILQQAELEGRRVKAVGSGWSIEDIATSRDWVVDISALKQRLRLPPLSASWQRRNVDSSGEERLVHVEAGIKIIDLNRMLDDMQLSLPTLGGAQGQTLAGAFSTSTHGSDFQQPPLCDLVQAVHLVTTGGQEVWIESSSHPVTTDDGALRRFLPCPETQIIRDDDALNAVRVGVGRFGVIYSCVLLARREFRLAEWTQYLTWSSVRGALASDFTGIAAFEALLALLDRPPAELAASEEVRYLDLAFNPRRSGSCWVRRRWLTSMPGDMRMEGASNFLCHPHVGNLIVAAAATALFGYSAAVFGIPGYGWIKGPEIAARATELSLMSTDPHLTGGKALAAAVNAVLASQIAQELNGLIEELNQIALNGQFDPSKLGKRGKNWMVSSGSSESAFDRTCFNGSSIEMIFGLDSPAYLLFIDALLAQAGNYHQVGYVSVRFSKRSQALLSMHNVNHPFAASIEVTSLDGLTHSRQWLEWLERKGLELGGRPHWGQHNKLTSSDVRTLYGSESPASSGLGRDKLSRWREQLLRIAGLSQTFSNDFTQARGLEPTSLWRPVTGARRIDGRVTHFCSEGAPWSPVAVDEAAAQSLVGLVNYFIESPEGGRPLFVRQILTTAPDDSEENNLQSLPDAPLPSYPRPADTLLHRRVTSVRRGTWADPGLARPTAQPIALVCNEAEGWAVTRAEAFQQIRAGTHTYALLRGGEETLLLARQYFTTFADGVPENNLSSLPDC